MQIADLLIVTFFGMEEKRSVAVVQKCFKAEKVGALSDAHMGTQYWFILHWSEYYLLKYHTAILRVILTTCFIHS